MLYLRLEVCGRILLVGVQHAVDMGHQMRVVHIQFAVQQSVVEAAVNLHVAVTVTVIVYPRHRSEGLVIFLFEVAGYIDVGCQYSEFVIVEQLFQVETAGIDVSGEVVFEELEFNVGIAGTRLEYPSCVEIAPVAIDLSPIAEILHLLYHVRNVAGEHLHAGVVDHQRTDVGCPLGCGTP